MAVIVPRGCDVRVYCVGAGSGRDLLRGWCCRRVRRHQGPSGPHSCSPCIDEQIAATPRRNLAVQTHGLPGVGYDCTQRSGPGTLDQTLSVLTHSVEGNAHDITAPSRSAGQELQQQEKVSEKKS